MLKLNLSLPKGVLALSFATLLVSISTSMSFSICPLYITQVLGFSMFALGTLDGLMEGFSQICKLLSGITSDYFKKKKPTLTVGFFLAAISKPIFIFANGIGMVVFSKFLERTSNGLMATPRDAYAASESPKNKIGESLGFMLSMKTTGCAIGSLIIALLLNYCTDFRLLLWIGFVPCLIAMFVCYKYVSENSNSKHKQYTDYYTSKKNKNSLKIKDIKKLTSKYWWTLLIATIFMAARFSDGFLVLKMQELGAPISLSASAIGIVNMASALCCLPAGQISDRIGRVNVLYFSFITLAISSCCFIFAKSPFLGIIGVLLWGAQRGTSQMLFSSMISDAVSEKILGTALGIFYLTIGVVSIIPGIIGGLLADINLNYTFTYSAAIAACALLVLVAHDVWNRSMSTKPKPAFTLDDEPQQAS